MLRESKLQDVVKQQEYHHELIMPIGVKTSAQIEAEIVKKKEN